MERLKKEGGIFLMGENDENKDKLSVDEESKKQFLEELKNKNMEEKRKLKEIKDKKDKEEESSLKAEESQGDNTQLDNTKADITKADNDEADNTKIEPAVNEKSSNPDTELKVKKSLVPHNLKLSIIDTAVSAVISVACLYLFDLILRLVFGYYVADMKGMYIILFLIASILYPVITRSCSSRKTLGEKFTTIPKGAD